MDLGLRMMAPTSIFTITLSIIHYYYIIIVFYYPFYLLSFVFTICITIVLSLFVLLLCLIELMHYIM